MTDRINSIFQQFDQLELRHLEYFFSNVLRILFMCRLVALLESNKEAAHSFLDAVVYEERSAIMVTYFFY